METQLRHLLGKLGRIGENHPEIYDSDVREAMREAIHNGFLSPMPDSAVPDEFGMYSDDANRKVEEALSEYIDLATQKAKALGLDFRERYDAFQNDNVEDDVPEQLTYDSVFGYVPPEAYDDSGNRKKQKLCPFKFSSYSLPKSTCMVFGLVEGILPNS